MQDNQTIANPTNKKPTVRTRSQTRASEIIKKNEEPAGIKWATVKTERTEPARLSPEKQEKVEENTDLMAVTSVMQLLAEMHVQRNGESDEMLKVPKRQMPMLVLAYKLA